MNVKHVLVRDGIDGEPEVSDHHALYVDGKKVFEGETENPEYLVAAYEEYGVTKDSVVTVNLGPQDVQKLIDNLQFPANLSDFTDTPVPTGSEDGCGDGCSCSNGGCTSAKPEPEDPDVASPPRPQKHIPFVPNNPDEFFVYEEAEYKLGLERLRRYAEDWPDKRDTLAKAVAGVDPEKDNSLGKLISETSSVVQAVLMQQWAHEIMKKTKEDSEKEDVAVDENGHKVNEQECPYLFWNLQFMRHSLAKTLIDSTRQGANAADLTGVVNNEALSAMSVFIDDFVHICPSLRKVDLGNKDPLRNTL